VFSFNCKGFKSSYGLIDDYLNNKNCDLMFVCEHWLTAQELAAYKQCFNASNR
jgi:hypothetical protein